MKRQIKTVLTIAVVLFVNQFSFAGVTEDLWKALKEANYPNALTAIAAGADVKSLDPAFGTPLNFAACWATADVVKALIEAKSEINFIAPTNGNTPMLNAAYWGNTEVFKLLLAAGSDVKMKNKIGQPFLAHVLFGGNASMEIIKLIVDAGADPNEKYQIMEVKDLTMMNALVGAKDPKEKVTYMQTISATMSKMGVTFPERLKNAKESDFTPLEDYANYLLEKGADPNQILAVWGSIIFQATDFGRTGVVLALINAKADMEVKGLIRDEAAHYYKITPLMMAALRGNNELVEAFCKAGASVNFVASTFDSGSTSNYRGQTETYWKTTTKNTAVSLANDNGHPDTVLLLRKYGGKGPKELKK